MAARFDRVAWWVPLPTLTEQRTAPDHRPDERALQELGAQSDTGARGPAGVAGHIPLWVAFAWSLFHRWYASPLPFVLNDTEARSIHLAFAMFLTFTGYPALKSSPRPSPSPWRWYAR